MAWWDDLNSGMPTGPRPGSIEALRAQMAAQPKPQPKKKQKDFWTDQISTGGGIGGAVGGAALGASLGSIVPGIGTAIGGLAGGILGGAFGSGAGEFTENVVTGEQDKFKNVGQEALLGGVFSAPPIRLAKGVIGGVGALAKGGGTSGAKLSLEQALTQPGMISGALKGAGAGLRAEGRGINVGTRLAGERIGNQKANQLNDFLDNVVQTKGSSPVKQLQGIEDFISQRSNQLSSAINQGNRALTKSDKNQLIKSMQNEFSKVIAPTERQRGIYNDIVTRIQQSNDVVGLDDLRKAIDDNINFARNAASPEPAAEQIYKLFRTGITDDVANKIGAAKALKGDLHKAFDAQELLLNKAGGKWDFGNAPNVAGIPVPKGASRLVTSAATKGLSAAGDIAGRLSGTKTSLGLRQGIGGLATPNGSNQPGTLEDALMGYSPDNPENTMPTTYNAMNTSTTVPNSSNMGQSYQNSAEMSSPYGRENLLYDIQRDPANADKYIAYYQQLQEVFAPQGSDKPLTQFQQERVDLQNALGMAENAVNQGSINYGPIGANVENFKSMFNAADPETLTFKNVISGLQAAITKARAGASLTDGEKKLLAQYTPNDTDSEQVVRSKLQQLRNLYGNSAPTGGGLNLEQALMSAGGY